MRGGDFDLPGLAPARGCGDRDGASSKQVHVATVGNERDGARIGIPREVIEFLGEPADIERAGDGDGLREPGRVERELAAGQGDGSACGDAVAGESEPGTQSAGDCRCARERQQDQIAARSDALAGAARAGDERRLDGKISRCGKRSSAAAEDAARGFDGDILPARRSKRIRAELEGLRGELQRPGGDCGRGKRGDIRRIAERDGGGAEGGRPGTLIVAADAAREERKPALRRAAEAAAAIHIDRAVAAQRERGDLLHFRKQRSGKHEVLRHRRAGERGRRAELDADLAAAEFQRLRGDEGGWIECGTVRRIEDHSGTRDARTRADGQQGSGGCRHIFPGERGIRVAAHADECAVAGNGEWIRGLRGSLRCGDGRSGGDVRAGLGYECDIAGCERVAGVVERDVRGANVHMGLAADAIAPTSEQDALGSPRTDCRGFQHRARGARCDAGAADDLDVRDAADVERSSAARARGCGEHATIDAQRGAAHQGERPRIRRQALHAGEIEALGGRDDEGTGAVVVIRDA